MATLGMHHLDGSEALRQSTLESHDGICVVIHASGQDAAISILPCQARDRAEKLRPIPMLHGFASGIVIAHGTGILSELGSITAQKIVETCKRSMKSNPEDQQSQ